MRSMVAAGLALATLAPVARADVLARHPRNGRCLVFRGRPTMLVGSGEHYGAVIWTLSPLNAANNVNGVGAVPKEKANTLDNGGLWGDQERWVATGVRSGSTR